MPAIFYSNVSPLKTMASDVHLHFSGYQAFMFIDKIRYEIQSFVSLSLQLKCSLAGKLKSFN